MKLKSNLFFLGILFSSSLFAQPQWKFPIAFEDGSGARDTIWYIWDSSATAGIDTLLGEGKVQMDPNAFNVFVTDFNPDSTKTHALPFSAVSLNNHIRAINYQYPILISWDSSLFSHYFSVGDSMVANAYMQNDYFFLVNNGGPIPGTFDMLQENHVDAPAYNWGSRNQFPMQIMVTRHSTVGINDVVQIDRVVSPNPFTEELTFRIADLNYVKILSTEGKIVFEKFFDRSFGRVETNNLNYLNEGIYILIYKTNQTNWHYEKIIKISNFK